MDKIHTAGQQLSETVAVIAANGIAIIGTIIAVLLQSFQDNLLMVIVFIDVIIGLSSVFWLRHKSKNNKLQNRKLELEIQKLEREKNK